VRGGASRPPRFFDRNSRELRIALGLPANPPNANRTPKAPVTKLVGPFGAFLIDKNSQNARVRECTQPRFDSLASRTRF
jgi:hypothetical protein